MANAHLRMSVSVVAAMFFASSASAVFTDIGTLNQLRHRIEIRVGTNSAGAIDVMNFGTIAGNKVGDGVTQPTATTDIAVRAWTFNFLLVNTDRTVSVTADSTSGMSCSTPATCGSVIIPFSKVSWVSGNSVAPSSGTFDVQSGAFTGSATQLIASFPSRRQMQNNLTFKYANDVVYPAGSYSGRVTFTASMP